MNTRLPLAAVIVLFKSPFLVFGYIIKNKALLILLIVFAIGFFAIKSFTGSTTPTDTPRYLETTPNINTAPIMMQTSSRLYYVADYTDDGVIITLKDWYSYDKKWTRNTKPLLLNREVYGLIKITAR